MFVRTEEQNLIIKDAKETKGDLRIRAYAGAAKTTTLREVAKDMPSTRFLYVAFNKSIQMDAEKSFPGNVTAKTAHSLAYGRTAMFEEKWKNKLNKRLRIIDYQHFLEIPSGLGPGFVMAVQDTVVRFQFSADGRIKEKHIPYETISKAEEAIAKRMSYVEGVPEEETDRDREDRLDQLKEEIVVYAQHLWELKIDKNNEIPIEHDTYLKLWQLSNPVIRGFDCILYDEAQDANPVILDIILQQTQRKFFVGDDFQNIYGFRGARNAMDQVKADKDHFLTKSFRFGVKIAALAEVILKGRDLKKPIQGNPEVPSVIGKVNRRKKYTHIFRTNAGLLKEALRLSKTHSKVAVVGKIDGAVAKIRSAHFLFDEKKEKVRDYEIKQYKDWDELETLAKKNDNFELITITEFVKEHRTAVPALLRQLEGSCTYPENQADAILTTGHKAKGREFEQVVLDPDFERRFMKDGKPRNPVSVDEINLFYVALTRAILKLELSPGMDEYVKFKKKD